MTATTYGICRGAAAGRRSPGPGGPHARVACQANMAAAPRISEYGIAQVPGAQAIRRSVAGRGPHDKLGSARRRRSLPAAAQHTEHVQAPLTGRRSGRSARNAARESASGSGHPAIKSRPGPGSTEPLNHETDQPAHVTLPVKACRPAQMREAQAPCSLYCLVLHLFQQDAEHPVFSGRFLLAGRAASRNRSRVLHCRRDNILVDGRQPAGGAGLSNTAARVCRPHMPRDAHSRPSI